MNPVRDLRLQETKPKKGSGEEPKPFWSFALEIILPNAPAWTGWRSTGWKYWPESGEAAPPMFRRGAYWHPSIKNVTENQKLEIGRWVQGALRDKGETENLGPVDKRLLALEQAGDDSAAHQKLWLTYGAEYPELYREWARGKAAEPSEWDLLWQTRDEGRLWPDALLAYNVTSLSTGGIGLDTFDEAVAAGAFSYADRAWILSALRAQAETGAAE